MAKRRPRVTLASLDRKINQNTARLDRRVDESTAHLDGRIDNLDRKFDVLSRKFDRTQMLAEEVRDDVRKVAEYLVVMDQKWDRRFDNYETRIVNCSACWRRG